MYVQSFQDEVFVYNLIQEILQSGQNQKNSVQIGVLKILFQQEIMGNPYLAQEQLKLLELNFTNKLNFTDRFLVMRLKF